GDGVRASVELLDRRARKSFKNDAVLATPSAIAPRELLPIELFAALIGALTAFFLLRGKGSLVVQIEYDPTMDAGLFSLRIAKLRRRRMGLKGGSEQQFVDAVRKRGSSVSARTASMVGKETTFPLPSGHWWVYLFGVYVKDRKPVGNFLTEKRVVVPRG